MTDRSVTVRLRADIAQFQRGLASAAVSTSAFAKRLEDADSRMAMLVQTGLALAPALAPIGAAAVPALAGLTTQLGFAAVAAGTTLLVFQGVGDALGALNKFQLEPTGKNLEKLNQALDALGPAGEVFVRHLQELRGELQILQDVAQQNMLPGVSEGIESVMQQMPRFEGVIASVASTLGDLFADAGADLAGPEWSEFFDYLEREAGPILEQTGKALGSFIEGITNMVMTFDPLSDDFVTGMLEMSESFVAWSDGLDSNQGFQEFVRYVQESGPQAIETLGAIASALVEFAEAAAPVGDVVLPMLEVLADVLGAVADSPAGPVIVGAAAAVGTLGRSLALLSAVGLRGGGSDTLLAKVLGTEKISASVKTLREASAATRDLSVAQRASAFAAVAQDKSVKAGLAQIGKAATAASGLALMTSGVADGMGLSNTASMALMGTLVGPWGTAVGGGVGLLMDMRAAGDQASESLERMERAVGNFDPAGLAELRASIAAVTSDLQDVRDVSGVGDFFSDVAKAPFGPTSQELNSARAESEETAQAIQVAWTNVAMALGEDFKDELGRNTLPTLDQLTAAVDRARPAMQALGISAEDLAGMDHDELVETSQAIADWTTHADSAEGRTEALADAFRQLDSDMVETATAAEILEGALESLLGPGLNLSAATDAWHSGLRNLNDELAKHSRSLTDTTDGADQNREAVRKMVKSSMDLLTAQANAGVGAKQLSANLKNQRQAILDAGAAAGISKGEMNDYLNTLGLTPKSIKTIINAVTAAAESNIDRTQAKLDALRDKNIYVTTTLRTVRQGSPGPQDPSSARGNLFSSVRSFANGDIANGHQAELAGPGPIRMWREPETQGEAYIPLANDSRRPRARRILDDTAAILGARSVEWYADGGKSGGKAEQAREEARRRREERERREEEKRVRQLEKQAIKDRLKSNLENDKQQANIAVRDAKRRLESAQDAGRPKSEILALKLALKEAENDRRQMQKRANEEMLAAERDAQIEVAKIALTAAEDQVQAAETQQKAAEEQLSTTMQLRNSLAAAVQGQFSDPLTGKGLAGLQATLAQNLNGGTSMTATMQALAAAGLDTTGPAAGLFQELASSEDLTTANELLAAGPEMIEFLEQQFAARDQANLDRANYVADTAYAEMIRLDQAALDTANAAAAAAQAHAARLEAQIAGVQAAVAQQGAQFGAALTGVTSAVAQMRDKGWAGVANWRNG